MDRRSFLTRFPICLAGGVASVFSAPAEESPERAAWRELLEKATQDYEAARNLIHWPWRWDEARPLLEQALGAAAQVWLRLRGVHRLERNQDWAFTACNTRDAASGIAWNEASLACRLLSDRCGHLARWRRGGPMTSAIATVQEQARKDLGRALDNVSQCIECTRMLLDRRQDALPPRPAIPYW